MLNSSKRLRQAPKGVKPNQFGLTWIELSEAIMAFHEPIAHHFYTGIGLRLQRLDSDIAEQVLLHFAQNGIANLPLHDSFLMHEGYASSLEPAMRSAFEKIVGTLRIQSSGILLSEPAAFCFFLIFWSHNDTSIPCACKTCVSFGGRLPNEILFTPTVQT